MIGCEEDEIRDRWSPQADDDSAARAAVVLEIDKYRHRAVAWRVCITNSGNLTKLDERQMRSASDAVELKDETPLHTSLPSLRSGIATHAHGPNWISRPRLPNGSALRALLRVTHLGGTPSRQTLMRTVLVVPNDVSRKLVLHRLHSHRQERESPEHLLFERAEEALDDRDPPALADRTEARTHTATIAPRQILRSKLWASIRDDVLRRGAASPSCNVEQAREVAGRRLREEEPRDDDSARVMIEDHRDPEGDFREGDVTLGGETYARNAAVETPSAHVHHDEVRERERLDNGALRVRGPSSRQPHLSGRSDHPMIEARAPMRSPPS